MDEGGRCAMLRLRSDVATLTDRTFYGANEQEGEGD